MYYICKKKENELGVRYGIMDTKDGVVEYYSPKEVISFVKEHKYKIDGVSRSEETGKWFIKVLKPSAYSVDSVESYDDSANVGIDSNITNGRLTINYPAQWGKLDDLSETDEVDELRLSLIFEPYKLYLDKILGDANITIDSSQLDYIDGLDCIGYSLVSIVGTPYYLSIYTNPSYARNSPRIHTGVPVGQVVVSGIGVDVVGVDDKSMDDCHFDSKLSNDIGVKLSEWLHNLL